MSYHRRYPIDDHFSNRTKFVNIENPINTHIKTFQVRIINDVIICTRIFYTDKCYDEYALI